MNEYFLLLCTSVYYKIADSFFREINIISVKEKINSHFVFRLGFYFKNYDKTKNNLITKYNPYIVFRYAVSL